MLAMMGSFKIGRSFEIGITIVLLAIMLDRLSKAWVAKQPEHFEKGTPWYMRHKFLLMSIFAFIFCVVAAQFYELASTIGRKQHFSQGKELDGFIKNVVLTNEYLKSATYGIRYFMNNFVLIPFRNFLLSIPTPAFIAGVVYVAWRVAGPRQALYAFAFLCGLPKWLVGSIRDYHLLRSVFDSCGYGVWNSSCCMGRCAACAKLSLSGRIDGSVLVALLSLLFRRSFIAAMSFIAAGISLHLMDMGHLWRDT